MKPKWKLSPSKNSRTWLYHHITPAHCKYSLMLKESGDECNEHLSHAVVYQACTFHIPSAKVVTSTLQPVFTPRGNRPPWYYLLTGTSTPGKSFVFFSQKKQKYGGNVDKMFNSIFTIKHFEKDSVNEKKFLHPGSLCLTVHYLLCQKMTKDTSEPAVIFHHSLLCCLLEYSQSTCLVHSLSIQASAWPAIFCLNGLFHSRLAETITKPPFILAHFSCLSLSHSCSESIHSIRCITLATARL